MAAAPPAARITAVGEFHAELSWPAGLAQCHFHTGPADTGFLPGPADRRPLRALLAAGFHARGARRVRQAERAGPADLHPVLALPVRPGAARLRRVHAPAPLGHGGGA